MKNIVVIGGGAAGMMAAGTAAKQGNHVTLVEKNEKLGKKLYITGKGRCNVTNATDPETLIANVPGNPYFLYSAFYTFDACALTELLNELGLRTKVERGNRVFPASDKASDVIKALHKYVTDNNATVLLEAEAKEILTEDDRISGVLLADGRRIKADAVIIATGGLSYPVTGSTGDGYTFAKAFGHQVSKLYPSLVPLRAKEDWVKELQGLSLKNIEITVRDGKSMLFKDFGEMLFTHYGISGPVVLSASRYLLGLYDKSPTVSIDLKPALDDKALDQRILRDFEKYINKDFRNCLDDLLPQKLIPIVIELSKIPPLKKAHDITKDERKTLCYIMKNLRVTINGTMGFNEAVITAGGVSVDEIDPSTMESKIASGLYFAGEVIDVDAYTGGFNLQIAFSTGFLAGKNAGK